MNAPREDLFQPTLTTTTQAAAPYSVQTTFFTGFFGGPFAALAILVTNSVRLRRLSRDAWVWATILALVLLGGWMLFHTAAGAEIRGWVEAQVGERAGRYSRQALGLVIIGIGYLVHRREQVNTDLAALQRPNGWIAGLACAIGGAALFIAYIAVIAG